jgi:hypothetical protein
LGAVSRYDPAIGFRKYPWAVFDFRRIVFDFWIGFSAIPPSMNWEAYFSNFPSGMKTGANIE